ncbi:glutathione S-transferase family protein [Hylemonella sp. W303a]|uniref:glutathione S-transferase family protein n=1 Tax=Hylemonella sp. W303a TaxID=3389873 RepID=UPI00396B1DCC
MLKLYIGNKNYSSWSMRPWVLLRQAGIPFEEVKVRFDSFEADSEFKRTIARVNPVGKVPVLTDGELVIWDTLAIVEYLAETFPDKHLWPQDRARRARARSVCAEMHAGFTALRTHCSMNIEADLSEAGARIWREQPAVQSDVLRITQMWRELLRESGREELLFGDFSIADAYFAPVCTRLKTYALPVPEDIAAYIARVHALAGVRAWVDDALAERDFIPFDEPYRQAPA